MLGIRPICPCFCSHMYFSKNTVEKHQVTAEICKNLSFWGILRSEVRSIVHEWPGVCPGLRPAQPFWGGRQKPGVVSVLWHRYSSSGVSLGEWHHAIICHECVGCCFWLDEWSAETTKKWCFFFKRMYLSGWALIWSLWRGNEIFGSLAAPRMTTSKECQKPTRPTAVKVKSSLRLKVSDVWGFFFEFTHRICWAINDTNS